MKQREHMRAVLLTGTLLLAVAAFDVLTCVQLRIPQLYLVPIVFIAWRVGFRASAAAAFLAAAIVYLGGVDAGYHNTRPISFYTEQLATLLSFLVAGLFTARLRSDQNRLAEFVRHDQLTGIANRTTLTERLELELARHRRSAQPFALIFIDCDNFKGLNDNFGHLEGDRFLKISAATLQNAMRTTDLTSRFSGDEFVVLLPETSPSGAQRVADALAARLREATTRTGWSATFSMGVAAFLTPPADADSAIRHADRLMYQAKQTGKDRSILQVFDA